MVFLVAFLHAMSLLLLARSSFCLVYGRVCRCLGGGNASGSGQVLWAGLSTDGRIVWSAVAMVSVSCASWAVSLLSRTAVSLEILSGDHVGVWRTLLVSDPVSDLRRRRSVFTFFLNSSPPVVLLFGDVHCCTDEHAVLIAGVSAVYGTIVLLSHACMGATSVVRTRRLKFAATKGVYADDFGLVSVPCPVPCRAGAIPAARSHRCIRLRPCLWLLPLRPRSAALCYAHGRCTHFQPWRPLLP